jgi:hypothetical protein
MSLSLDNSILEHNMAYHMEHHILVQDNIELVYCILAMVLMDGNNCHILEYLISFSGLAQYNMELALDNMELALDNMDVALDKCSLYT